MLFLPKRFVEKAPIASFQATEFSIAQKINQRAVFIDGRGEAKNPQNAFRPERKRNIETNPQRIAAIKFRPVEVHTALAFTLDDESIGIARGAHVVLERTAPKREGLAVKKGPVLRIRKVLENQNPIRL